VDGALVIRKGARLIVVTLLLLTVWLECALHLADHSTATAVDAIPVAVEAAVVVAAVLAFESLAAIVTFRTVVTLKAFRTLESFGPIGAVLRPFGRPIRTAVGSAFESFCAFVASIVSALGSLEPFWTVVANDPLITLGAFEPLWPICAVSSIGALGSVGSIGSLDTRRPFGSLRSFVSLGPIGEVSSLGRQIWPFDTLAAVV